MNYRGVSLSNADNRWPNHFRSGKGYDGWSRMIDFDCAEVYYCVLGVCLTFWRRHYVFWTEKD